MKGRRKDWTVEIYIKPVFLHIYIGLSLEVAELTLRTFKNACCTISADRAVDGSIGLFRNKDRLVPFKVRISTQVQFWVHEGAHDVDDEIRSEPLATRAWAFQEWVLSPRILHFGTRQMFWECNSGVTFQNDCMESFFCHRYYTQNGRLRRRDFKSKTHPSAEIDFHEKFREWGELVQEYSARSLTEENDKLVALSGVAKCQQEIFQDTYAAGLWKRTIHFELLWHVQGMNASRPLHNYRAPSWSWASINGQISFPFRDDILYAEYLFSISNLKVDAAGDDSTGQINGACIHGIGILKEARWDKQTDCVFLQNSSSYQSITLHTGNNTHFLVKGVFFDLPSDKIENPRIYCLPLIANITGLGGLILCRTNSTGHFRRIGMFEIDHSELAVAALKYDFPASPVEGENYLLGLRALRDIWQSTQVNKSSQLYGIRARGLNSQENIAQRLDDIALDSGPHLLYKNDPEQVQGFERLIPQTISII